MLIVKYIFVSEFKYECDTKQQLQYTSLKAKKTDYLLVAETIGVTHPVLQERLHARVS